MLPRGGCTFLLVFAVGAGAIGCVGDAGVSGGDAGTGGGGPGGNRTDGGTGSSTGSGGAGTGAVVGTGAVTGTGGGTGTGGNGGNIGVVSPLLPARIRRLTNAEYDASVRVLLGTTMTMAATSFPPDSRQGIFARGGYTLNDAQRVDPILGKQLSDSAVALVAEARGNGKLAAQAPCASTTTTTAAEACARTFITDFGARAFRRPLTTDEINAFLVVYRVGATGGTYNDGIDLIARAALQSAGFLYITEIGDGTAAAGANVTLTPEESSSVLSYLLTSSPPDVMLVTMARAGGLADPAGRETQARRLLTSTSGQDATVRFVREMFSLDQITVTDKDTTAYPMFAAAKNSIVAESANFVREVLTKGAGTIEELLNANWTIADATLAGVYGVTSAGATAHTSLAATGRRGLLNQAAFLSVFAHASESGPVLRGVAIMRQVACMPLKSPTELNIDVTPPPFDATKTMRQRFSDHAADPLCASCHTSIDGFGFAFEKFDGMGAARPVANGKPTENGMPVDTSTVIAGTDFDGSYADSNALAVAMAGSAQVRTCLARQIFRSSTGRSDDSVKGSEEAFVQYWKQLPVAQQSSVVETLVSYVKNPTFIQRRTQ